MPPPRRAQAVDAPADLPLARQFLAQADRHFAARRFPESISTVAPAAALPERAIVAAGVLPPTVVVGVTLTVQ